MTYTYNSSNVLKISAFLRVRSTSENDVTCTFNTIIFLVFIEKKVNFLLFYTFQEYNGKQTTSIVISS